MKKTKKTMLAWLLTLAMIVTGLTVPSSSGKVEAADTVSLSVVSGSSPLTMAANPDYTDYIGDIEFNVPTEIDTKDKVASVNPVVSVTLTITGSTQSSSTLSAMIFAQDGNYNWNTGTAQSVSVGQTVTLSYDFTGMEWTNNTLKKLGVRFADNSENTGTITYTMSAQVSLGSGSSSSSSGSESSGAAADDTRVDESTVSVTATESKSNANWSEYSFSIANHSSEAVTGVQIVLPTSGSPKDLKSFETITTAYYSSELSGVYIYYAGTIAAGGSVSLSKIGFDPTTVTVSAAYVRAVNCATVSQLKYSLTGEKKTMAYEDTPYGKHGKLSLKKVDGYGNAPVIVDKNGDPFQLRGASTHGMQWFPQYVNQDAFQSLRDEWGVNMVRLVSYVKEYGGYTTGSDCQAVLDGYIEKGVEAATNLGLYVIIDWHVLDFNPNDTIDDAKKFFQKYAEKYKGCDNVIFEICNEPTNVDWYTEGSTNDLYTYCKTISNIIRNDCGNDSIIVCGTNTYSQDVDQVAAKPLANDGFENIMYTFHFYAASHGDDLRNKVRNAVAAGTPIFVTEFGICEYTGDGTVDTTSADTWIKLFDEYNISYTCWSLCNKDESASYFLSTSTKTSGWTEEDLSATAIWLINTNRAHEEKENGTTSSGTEGTESSGSGTETGGSSQETGNSGSASGTEGTGSSGSASGTEGTGSTGSASGTEGTGSSGSASGTEGTGSTGSVSGTEGTGTGSTGNVSGTEGTGSTGSVSGTEGTGNTGSVSGTEGTGNTGSASGTEGTGSTGSSGSTGGGRKFLCKPGDGWNNHQSNDNAFCHHNGIFHCFGIQESFRSAEKVCDTFEKREKSTYCHQDKGSGRQREKIHDCGEEKYYHRYKERCCDRTSEGNGPSKGSYEERCIGMVPYRSTTIVT